MTRVFSDARHAGHDPSVEIQCGVALPAFDVPGRHAAMLAAVAARDDVLLADPSGHGLEPLLAVHETEMLEFLAACWDELSPLRPDPSSDLLFADTFPHVSFAASLAQGSLTRVGGLGRLGRFCFDTITAIGPGTYDAARSSADAALSAVDAIISGDRHALAICRPPGHHAGRRTFGGGTYLNNAAIAAQALRTGGHASVAVLDVDFHHGNGTQDIFYERDDVLFASLHGAPERTWPFFSGWEEERGDGRGLGANVNITLPAGVDGPAYRGALARALDAIRDFGATAVVVALGFDAAAGDPAGDGNLKTADYEAIAADIAGLGLPLAVTIEGGYQVTSLGPQLDAWLDGALS